MKPKHTVLTLVTKDLAKTYEFYKDGLGLEKVTQFDGIVQIELGGMMIFFADEKGFLKYSSHTQTQPYYPQQSVQGFLSCSIETQAEIDDILVEVKAAGGEVFSTQTAKHQNGWVQYLGYFKDLDGHLWQLVHNIRKE